MSARYEYLFTRYQDFIKENQELDILVRMMYGIPKAEIVLQENEKDKPTALIVQENVYDRFKGLQHSEFMYTTSPPEDQVKLSQSGVRLNAVVNAQYTFKPKASCASPLESANNTTFQSSKFSKVHPFDRLVSRATSAHEIVSIEVRGDCSIPTISMVQVPRKSNMKFRIKRPPTGKS
jgi:hypothetical protein